MSIPKTDRISVEHKFLLLEVPCLCDFLFARSRGLQCINKCIVSILCAEGYEGLEVSFVGDLEPTPILNV